MSETVIKVENISKFYQLGLINHGTLAKDLQGWWAKIRGKDDPNSRISMASNKNANADTDFIYALKDVSFDVKQGEVLGIIGANGAGKSTLLKILSRVTSPTSGCIKIKGRIGSLLEVGTGFHPELTGRENIYLNGAILGMRKHEIDRKLDEIIDFSGVEKFIDTPVKRYSSGMYVRLAFAVAAHLDPEILVVDEVLAVGDAEFQKKCLGKMDDVSKKEGRTVLFVSHNMAMTRNLCNKGVVLDKGEIVFDGDIETAIEKYVGVFTNEFPVHYDLNQYVHPLYAMSGKVYLETIDFLNIKTASIKPDETLNIKITWKEIENSDVFFRICINALDGTLIGLIDSNNAANKIHKEHHVSNIQVDLSSLGPGKYGLRFEAYKFDNGLSFQFDATPFIPIEVKKGHRFKYINWYNQYWGRVMFPPIKYEDES